jgi:hypothetical protein
LAIKPIKERTFVAEQYKDSRAEGYVTYYTKANWDRWNMATDQVAIDLAAHDADYQTALAAYEMKAKEIAAQREFLTKKLSDISMKQADAQVDQEKFKAKEEAAREAQYAEDLTEREQKLAVVPSSSASRSSGYGSGKGEYTYQNAEDDLLDEITNVGNRRKRVEAALSGSNKVTAESLPSVIAKYDKASRGSTFPGDSQSTEVSAAAFANRTRSSLINQGMTEEAADEVLLGALADYPKLTADVANGRARVDARVEEKSGSGTGRSRSSSRGSYQKDYDIYNPAPLADQPPTTAYDAEKARIEAELAGLEATPDVPKQTPFDAITDARNIYKDKFGQLGGTKLGVGGKPVGHYKDLMPYELTNALAQTESFFKTYVDDFVSKARLEAKKQGRELTVDELKIAVEAGKQRAREILFGGMPDVPSDLGSESDVGSETGNPPDGPVPGPPTPPTQPTSTPIPPATEPPPSIPGPPTTPVPPPAPTSTEQSIPPVTPPIPGTPSTSPDSTTGPARGTENPPNNGDTRPGGEYWEYREDYVPPVQRTNQQDVDYLNGPLSITPVPPRTRDPDPKPRPESPQPGLTRPPPEPPKAPPQTDDDKDKSARINTFFKGVQSIEDNPKAAAKGITKTPAGRFVAALYDINKSKGAAALGMKEMTDQIVREYAGNPEAQRKAVQRLAELSMLDLKSSKLG